MACIEHPTRVELVWLWTHYVLRVTACARLADSTQRTKIQDVFFWCHEVLDCTRHGSRFPTILESLCSLWPGTGEGMSPTAVFNDLLFKIAIRSDRLCILVAGLLGAFVTAWNLQRTNRGLSLNFKQITYGRIKMMTALCPAWAHTFQTMCLGFSPGTPQT